MAGDAGDLASGTYGVTPIAPNTKISLPGLTSAVAPVDPNAALIQQMLDMMAAGPAVPAGPDPAIAAAEAAALAEQNRITAGLNDLDSAYGAYLDASNSATDYINQQIASERSNAALLGVDYGITDEQKTERISNQFASIYSASAYDQLQNLNNEFGTGSLEFLVQRGVAVDQTAETTPNAVTRSRGQTISSGLIEEEPLASASSILGGG